MPDFSSRDYDTIKRDLLARADRVFPKWTDRDPSDFGMLFIDLWAYAADVMHYYIDRSANEAFLPTATQRESVLALANLLDYTPRSRTSAAATLYVSNQSPASYTVAPLTEFIARSDNKTYHVYTPLGGTAASSTTINIEVREGLLTTDETIGNSSGVGGQRYALANSGAVVSSITVNVFEGGDTGPPTAYQRVPRITSAGTGDRVFSTNIAADGTVEIIFGTSLNGFVPPQNAKITATYASSSGAAGNLPSGSVTAFKSASPAGIFITPPNTLPSTAFSGGLDEESIASMKQMIPSIISAQNRAVTRSDFVSLATQVEGVSKATIAFVPGTGSGASATNASVTVYAQPARSDYLIASDLLAGGIPGQTVSTTMQANVIAAIQPLALLGVTVLCSPTVKWQPLDIAANVYVNERFVASWVKRDVENALDQLFMFDNVFFGQRISLGQIHRIILNVPGVDYTNVVIFDKSGFVTVQPSILIDPLMLPKEGTVAITPIGGITS